MPITTASVLNALRSSPKEALTGPVRRGDAETVAAHLSVLPPELAALYRAAGEPQRVARSLTSPGEIARYDGDLDEARALHQEALDVWRATGDVAGTAGALLDLAVVSHLRGDHANGLAELDRDPGADLDAFGHGNADGDAAAARPVRPGADDPRRPGSAARVRSDPRRQARPGRPPKLRPEAGSTGM